MGQMHVFIAVSVIISTFSMVKAFEDFPEQYIETSSSRSWIRNIIAPKLEEMKKDGKVKHLTTNPNSLNLCKCGNLECYEFSEGHLSKIFPENPEYKEVCVTDGKCFHSSNSRGIHKYGCIDKMADGSIPTSLCIKTITHQNEDGCCTGMFCANQTTLAESGTYTDSWVFRAICAVILLAFILSVVACVIIGGKCWSCCLPEVVPNEGSMGAIEDLRARNEEPSASESNNSSPRDSRDDSPDTSPDASSGATPDVAPPTSGANGKQKFPPPRRDEDREPLAVRAQSTPTTENPSSSLSFEGLGIGKNAKSSTSASPILDESKDEEKDSLAETSSIESDNKKVLASSSASKKHKDDGNRTHQAVINEKVDLVVPSFPSIKAKQQKIRNVGISPYPSSHPSAVERKEIESSTDSADKKTGDEKKRHFSAETSSIESGNTKAPTASTSSNEHKDDGYQTHPSVDGPSSCSEFRTSSSSSSSQEDKNVRELAKEQADDDNVFLTTETSD